MRESFFEDDREKAIMTWQEPFVFIIVFAAAAYIGRAFMQQFGSAQSPQQTTCAKCSGCSTAPKAPPQTLFQISGREND